MAETSSKPLSDGEIAELDQILGAIPIDRDPLDVEMMDGFLVGILLQPDPVSPSAWLPLIFDADAHDAALSGDAPQEQRAVELIMRRYHELAACIAAREPFDPIVFEIEDERGEAVQGKDGIAALAPWAAGFTNALNAFPALRDAAENDEELAATMIGILRHLPMEPEAEAELREEFEREQEDIDRDAPLADLDEALDELMACIFGIADITRPNRPIVRETPKVGRNDPCPCGSGRKYKICHGREVH
jgi:uncharacterized protein